ncbi:MAG: AMP-binding protein [Candidatus Latescibacterota bacterium]|nr:AMP-binding protein [Candidatus Latescibacterota bacterium]
MIREYYSGRSLLVTGGTGFVGQALIAKILRDLGEEVKRIYVLIRPRRRADGRVVGVEQRLKDELLESSLFSTLRQQRGAAAFARLTAKIVPVEWGPRQERLGISEADRRRIVDDIDLVFNSAATVVFDEPLDQSLAVNARGPVELLRLAQSARKDVHFIHISTAYVSGQLTGAIPDAPLPVNRDIHGMQSPTAPDFDPREEIDSCEASCRGLYHQAESEAKTRTFRREILRQARLRTRKMTSARMEELVADRRRRWIKRCLVEEGMRRAKERGWNDVYTYTKAMGEQMLDLKRGETPLVIVRPAIIESSLSDPEPGWITGLKVMDPLVAAYGRGLMPDFPAQRDLAVDVIPVDLVVNTTLVAATQAQESEVKVYHVATSSENPVKIHEVFDSVRAHFQRSPMIDRDGRTPDLPDWSYSSVRRFRSRFRLRYLWPLMVQQWLLDRLPARFASAKRKRLLGTLKVRLQRVLYYTEIYHPYTNLDCRFETDRSRHLFESLNAEEQVDFNMDVQRIEWRKYIADIHLPGMRRHVLKDVTASEAVLPDAPEELSEGEERLIAEAEVRTIPDLLRWACACYDDAVAFQMRRVGGWQRWTYRELLAEVESRATCWRAAGMAPGQRVLLCGDNCPEWVFSYMACSVLGVCVVPVDPQTPSDELTRIAEFCHASGLVSSAAVQGRLSTPLPSLQIIDLEDGSVRSSNLERPAVADEHVVVRSEMEASIIFTSGTRVDPRGVLLTHDNLISDLMALSEVQRVWETDRILSLLPLHHGLEFTGSMLMSIWGGASTTYLETLNSRRILEVIAEVGITAMVAVPRLLKILADRAQRLDGKGDKSGETWQLLSGMRLAVSGGAPLSTDLFDQYHRYGISIYEGYGLTETSPIVTVNPPGRARPGSVGTPLPGVEVQISGAETSGEVGEVLVRGAIVSAGYLKRDDLTQKIFDAGWLRTGDLGYLDDDGYLFLTGRTKDLIVTGAGKNVYPEDVEAAYADLPHINDFAVVGVSSPRTLSEEVHAVVALTPNVDEARAEQEIREQAYAISRDLPTYQRIVRFHVSRRPLPRAEDGRTDRNALRCQLASQPDGGEPATENEVESLAPWEQAIYRRIGEVAGLAVSEIVAHAHDPLSTVLDSLMCVEFSAFLCEVSVDRGHDFSPSRLRQRSLHSVLELLASDLQAERTWPWGRYWQELLSPAVSIPAAAASERAGEGLLAHLHRRRWRLSLLGAEHLPAAGPYVVVANHCTSLDAAVIRVALGHRVRHMVAVAPHRPPRASGLLDRTAQSGVEWITVDEENSIEDVLTKAARSLSATTPLLVFPETVAAAAADAGTHTGVLRRFRSGIGALAVELEVPVIPAHISCRDGGYGVQFAEAVTSAVFVEREQLTRYEVYREFSEALRERIQELAKATIADSKAS